MSENNQICKYLKKEFRQSKERNGTFVQNQYLVTYCNHPELKKYRVDTFCNYETENPKCSYFISSIDEINF